MPKRKALTDSQGDVRSLGVSDMKRMKPFSELPATLQKTLRGVGERGPQKSPTKERISIRLSSEVLAHFRSSGAGWQGRIDMTLRDAVKAKRPRRRAA